MGFLNNNINYLNTFNTLDALIVVYIHIVLSLFCYT